jgi:hypothetical protein
VQQGRKKGERMEGDAWNAELSPTCFEEGHGPEFEKAELDALERVVGDARAEAQILTLPLLKNITNNFSTENIIGEGGSGVVYLVSTIKLLSR